MDNILAESVVENKPNQHYVWQHYLKPWTYNGQIYCLRNHNKLIHTQTRNVASQRYFYQIDGLTLNDCQLIRKIFGDRQNEYLKRLLDGWIRPVETMIHLKSIIEKTGIITPNMEKEIELLFKNQLEELHSEIECSAISGLEKLQNNDASFFLDTSEENDDDVDFVLFLCFQYFRTKNMKKSVAINFSKLEASIFTNIDKAFNLIVPILATRLGYSLLHLIQNGKFHCCLISNNTPVSFITGDQPIVNTLASLNPEFETTKLELYYPLTPNLALLISENQSNDFAASLDDVNKFNKRIAVQSLESIFAADESDLELYKSDSV